MHKYAEALKISLQLNFKGIVPNNGSQINAPYKKVKSQLKKIIKQKISVDQIDEIIMLLSRYIFNEQIEGLAHTDQSVAKEIFKQRLQCIKPEIEKTLGNDITDGEYINIVTLLIDYMRMFDKDYLDSFKSPTFINNYTNPFDNCEAIKPKLDALFKRGLTDGEHFLIIESWLSYMYLAQDVLKNDTFQEKIVEARDDLSNITAAKESEIASINLLMKKLMSFRNFIQIDLTDLQVMKEKAEEQRGYLDQLDQALTFDNGKPLNVHKLSENAFFSVLFCAESLGLSAPKLNKEGNPFIKFLDILIGFTAIGIDPSDITNRLSKTYKKYKKFTAENPEMQMLVTELLKIIGNNPNCFSIVLAANKIFQSRLLPLNLRSNTSLISKDA